MTEKIKIGHKYRYKTIVSRIEQGIERFIPKTVEGRVIMKLRSKDNKRLIMLNNCRVYPRGHGVWERVLELNEKGGGVQ